MQAQIWPSIHLGVLEQAIMEVMWSSSSSVMTAREVHREVLPQRPVAYTTITTTMVSLENKGFLLTEGRAGRGRIVQYRVSASREETERVYIERALDSLLHLNADIVHTWVERRLMRTA